MTPRDIPNERVRNIERQRPDLKDITFQTRNFLEINPQSAKGYVFYCDPPYRDTTTYKTEQFPYDEFYDWCRELSKNNTVLISEYSMPNDFDVVWEREHRTSLDSEKKANDDKYTRIERLFTYKAK